MYAASEEVSPFGVKLTLALMFGDSRASPLALLARSRQSFGLAVQERGSNVGGRRCKNRRRKRKLGSCSPSKASILFMSAKGLSSPGPSMYVLEVFVLQEVEDAEASRTRL